MLSYYEAMLITVLSMQLLLLLFVAWLTWRFSQGIRRICRLIINKMDCDELIDSLLAEQGTSSNKNAETTTTTREQEMPVEPSCPRESLPSNVKHRERLAALAAGGQAKQYLGKIYTAEQIDGLNDAEIEKLYSRYEARLGTAMTKTLGCAALQIYAGVVSMLIPVDSQPALIADLEDDPFVEHALSSAACELYHRYGMFLAPLTAALTTLKHTRFGHQCPKSVSSISDDGECSNVGEPTSAGEPSTCSSGA